MGHYFLDILYNQSINSTPELREAIKKLWIEKIGESVLEVAGQEHAKEDSHRHWKSWIS